MNDTVGVRISMDSQQAMGRNLRRSGAMSTEKRAHFTKEWVQAKEVLDSAVKHYRRPFVFAMMSGFMAMLIQAYRIYFNKAFVEDNFSFSTAAYTTYASTLGFLLVFRASQAYSRFWDGITSAYGWVGNFTDCTYSLFAFARFKDIDPDGRIDFLHTAARLVSLLGATILLDLEGSNNDAHISQQMQVLDVDGLDPAWLVRLAESDAKPEVVFHAI